MTGSPPKSGFARLAPELMVSDLAASRRFWEDLLGFAEAYGRPGEGFTYLERHEGAQVMLSRINPAWRTGELTQPFGRGVMLQIEVKSLDGIVARLRKASWPLLREPADVWRQWGAVQGGRREILLQDPDGYLVMVASPIEGS
jgi:catechol 2,3-dioxygenase-like lactoylglutathione lyase family enzyme